MTASALSYWLALLHTPGIGPSRFLALVAKYPNLEELFTLSTNALARLSLPPSLHTPDWQSVEQDLTWSQQPNHHIITYHDPRYPALLQQIADPPPVLFVKGNHSILLEQQLAIVGSRTPTPTGIETTEQFAHALNQAGLTITSGLAVGIDAASHRGALAGNGKTVAVVGTGLDQVYPKQHQGLAEEIATQGALVSEFPISTPPQAKNFPRRNRIVSGLSLGVLVVEANLRSGSLITTRFALEQGREVFAIPGSIHNPLAKGCHALLKQGAKLVETATDVLEELGSLGACRTTPSFSPASLGLDVGYQNLLQCIGYEPTSFDTLVGRSGLAAPVLSSMLLMLELQGHIATSPNGYIRAKI